MLYRLRVPATCVVLAALLFGSGGCAPPMTGASVQNSPNAFLNAVQSTSNPVAGSISDPNAWNCPSSPNITPTGYDNFNESEIFTVCRSTTNAAQFIISGTTENSGLCVYPMNATQNSMVLVDQPQCFNVGTSSITLTFTAQNINYMAIVDINFSNQMSACLSSASPCPDNSQGYVE